MQLTMPSSISTILNQSQRVVIFIIIIATLSACVTQNFSEDKPVVDRDVSNDQIARTRISLALGYLKIGNTTQAKQNLEKAKQYAPSLIEVHTAFAHYFESVGEYAQAEKAYLSALDINNQDPNTLNNFGVFLCRQSRVDEAEIYFLKAIKVPSYLRVSESYENIALCYLKESNFLKAELALKRSIDHSPNSASSLFQMAQLQYAKAKFENSVVYLNRFELATRRFSAEAIALAFKVNKKLGKDDIANNYASMLLKMFPDSSQAKAYIKNGLKQIEADKLAIQYRKYRLMSLSRKSNKKPIIVSKKTVTKKDGLKQRHPKILVANEKLVDDETIIEQTSQSIAANSKIATQGIQSKTKPTQTTKDNGANIVAKTHVVQKGENLFQISVKYNILISSLRRWNNLTEVNIQVGQMLRLTEPK